MAEKWDRLFLSKRFETEEPFSFRINRSVILDCYVKICVTNQNFTSSLPVSILFHFCICNHFDNALIFLSPD
jgi:hypothetical protein